MLGEYVKLIKTGKIFEQGGYDPTNQTVKIVSSDGTSSIVQRFEVEVITAEEEIQFLRSTGIPN